MNVWECVCIVARGEEVGRQVGRRLAGGLHHPGDSARIALAADQEDSPLQSKRSSMSLSSNFSFSANCGCPIAFPFILISNSLN